MMSVQDPEIELFFKGSALRKDMNSMTKGTKLSFDLLLHRSTTLQRKQACAVEKSPSQSSGSKVD